MLSILVIGLAVVLNAGKSAAEDEDAGYLGVYLGGLDEELRESLKFEDVGGAFIDGVVPGGPAEKAGIQDGDIIVQFDGKDVANESDLRHLIRSTPPGKTVNIKVFREGVSKDLTVKIGEAPEEAEETDLFKKSYRRYLDLSELGRCPCGAWLGVEIQNLTEQLGEYFKVEDGEGVLITSVVEKSPAEKSGLKAGDVIIAVGDQEVERRYDLIRILRDKKENDTINLTVMRDGKKKTVSVTLGAPPKDCCPQAPGWRKYGMMRYFGDDEDWEDLGDQVRDLRFKLEYPSKDLQDQLDQLKAEIEKLKAELKQK
jgi:C-terminal processing protease CtpA/Prc/uncharacterized small protein (DUF1192 family)